MSRSFDEPVPYAGLSSAEAEKRLKIHGTNDVRQKTRLRPFLLFLKKFNSPLLLIIIFASTVSFFVGETLNAAILVAMVFLSVILDFINSYRSERAVETLLARVVITATVRRDHKTQEIPLANIVPGDVVLLHAGDVIPADGYLLETHNLFVNQSTITGESFPAEKQRAVARVRTVLGPDAVDTVLMGTSVVTGSGVMTVLRTGRSTQFGRIADQISRTDLGTDFERRIRSFSLFILRLVSVMVAVVFLVNAVSGRGWLTSFIFAIAISIGLTPELLPVILSVSLAHGSRRMAKKDVIVKNLSSIQNFGSMNILCTDKTGTLTEDRITLVKYVDLYGASSDRVLLHAYLNSLFHTGVENPLDNAVKAYRCLDVSAYKKISEIPFDYKRKRESITVAHGPRCLLITKGAPEAIFDICSLDKQARLLAQEQYDRLSQDGFRVLAVASKQLDRASANPKQEEQDMTFLGFTAFLDPPKQTAAKTIQQLAHLGIEIKIITGDSDVLTKKICKEINLPLRGILTSDEICRMTDEALARAAIRTTIFARITPEQKERIVFCLKASGNVVGYLGDGINDAPAIKAADIGISVNNAVDVAKETADIILLRKSLTVIQDGVIEGRRTFRNTMKYLLMGFSSNFGNMFSMMIASAFLPFLPMLPAQVLLNNMLYDVSQITLSTDTVDDEDVRKPVKWNMRFIRAYMLVFGLVSSLFDLLTFGVLYFGFRLGESAFQTGWFIESLATQTLVIHIIRTKKLPFIASRPSTKLFWNTLLVVLFAWILPYFSLGLLFHFSPLPISVFFAILGLVLVYLVLAELTKRLFYKRFSESFS